MAQTVTVTKTGSPEQGRPEESAGITYFRLANDAGKSAKHIGVHRQ